MKCSPACANHGKCSENPALCWYTAINSELTVPMVRQGRRKEPRMIVTMPDIGYELRPYDSGVCWEVFKWRDAYIVAKGAHRGNKVEAKWVSLGRYPSTLAGGLTMIYEMALLDGVDAKSAREAAEHCSLVGDTIVGAIEALSSVYDLTEAS